jgi:hypothetical protein
MRRSFADRDESENEKSKSIDLFRPFIGAVIGVCIFWAFLFLGQDVKQAQMNANAFITPGILAVLVLKLSFSMDIVMGTPQFSIMVAIISTIPIAILGAMAASRNPKVRYAAGEFFVIYGIFCMIGLLAISKLYPLLETP